MIDSLTAFTVVPKYHRSRTSYRVYAKGGRDPVALVRSGGAPDSLRLLEVLAGPGLDQSVGWVSFAGAFGPDRVRIGQVTTRGGALGKQRWVVTQNGLPDLHGERAGVFASVRDHMLVRSVLTSGYADAALSAKVRFAGPGGAGFEFTRQPGIRTRYKVRVHEARVSRLVVLAAVLNYDFWANADPRKGIAEVTANPFKI